MPDIAAPTLDPRVNAFRADLADAALRAVVTAASYVEPMMRQCVRGVVPMLKEPRADAEQVSDARYGEFLDVFEIRTDGYAWVQNRTDRYVGYIRGIGTLSEEIASLSYRVTALRSYVLVEPHVRAPAMDQVTLGSYVRVVREEQGFAELAGGGFIAMTAIAMTEDANDPDYIFTAGRMLGTPYLWGGRTPLGIDCSGFVQLALDMAGIDAPRDSDQQREAFGQALSVPWRDMDWQRGDLVFFPGHVGMMTGPDHIIHANARTMRVTVEPLSEVVRADLTIIAVGRNVAGLHT